MVASATVDSEIFITDKVDMQFLSWST